MSGKFFSYKFRIFFYFFNSLVCNFCQNKLTIELYSIISFVIQFIQLLNKVLLFSQIPFPSRSKTISKKMCLISSVFEVFTQKRNVETGSHSTTKYRNKVHSQKFSIKTKKMTEKASICFDKPSRLKKSTQSVKLVWGKDYLSPTDEILLFRDIQVEVAQL